ncbi:MAG: HEAT repeat domain-containing protein, partial [Planctomycetota bacterium]
QFRNALPRTGGKSRLTIIQNLGVLADVDSVSALQKAVDDEDGEIRMAAVWALANIGDGSSVDILLKAADAEGTYERIKATKACLLLAEKLLVAGKKDRAVKIYQHLYDSRSSSDEAYISEAAKEGLIAAGR